MLKKENRLRLFKLNNPIQIKSETFSFKIGQNKEGLNRFAFVVSKKVDKRAVVRNRLKRLTSSAAMEILDKIEKGWDFIIYPKKEAIQKTRSEIIEEMRSLLIKQKLLK